MFQSKDRQAIFVAGLVTIIIAIMMLVNTFTDPDIDLLVSLVALGLSFLIFVAAYITNTQAWSLIGAYVTGAILVLLISLNWFNLMGIAVPTLVLSLIALPFLVTWWFNQEQWGWLIPSYVLLAIIPILYIGENSTYEENLIPAYVLAAIGLPFVVAAILSRKNGFYIPGVILWLIAGGFLAIQFGLPSNWLTIGVPVAGIIIGSFLLFRAFTAQSEQQQQQ